MRNLFQIRFVLVLLLAGVILLGQNPARAEMVSYDLEFADFFAGFGSGIATFDDTPVGAGTLDGATLYDFTSLIGSGDYGNWTTSTFEYDPSDGQTLWSFFAELTGFYAGPVVDSGLTPIEALEQNFAYVESAGDLTWARTTSPVPEPATMLLLASGLVGLVGVRRRFKK